MHKDIMKLNMQQLFHDLLLRYMHHLYISKGAIIRMK